MTSIILKFYFNADALRFQLKLIGSDEGLKTESLIFTNSDIMQMTADFEIKNFNSET